MSNTYDQLGNPLTYYNGRRYYFTWDEGRQLTSTTLSGSTFTYKYNQDGIRVEKIENGVKHSYYLNGTQIEREVQSDATTGALIRDLRYYYDIMGTASHVEIYDDEGTRTKYTLETNIQGDVIAIYSDTGTKIAEYRYDAWGKCTVLNPDGTENVNSSFIGNINPFRYRGYYYDTETGLYYLNARYYDSETKRFINADDISYLGANGDLQGFNLYAYCYNKPISVAYSNFDGENARLANLLGVLHSDSNGVGGAISDSKKPSSIPNWIGVLSTGLDHGFTMINPIRSAVACLQFTDLWDLMRLDGVTELSGTLSKVATGFGWGLSIAGGAIAGYEKYISGASVSSSIAGGLINAGIGIAGMYVSGAVASAVMATLASSSLAIPGGVIIVGGAVIAIGVGVGFDHSFTKLEIGGNTLEGHLNNLADWIIFWD